MDDTPKYVLCSLINKYGRSICGEAGRLEGMLRDLCGEYKKEIFVMVHALKGGVADALIGAEGQIPVVAIINTQAARLSERYGFSMEISLWATGTWAEALGILTDAPPFPSGLENSVAKCRAVDDELIMESIMMLGDNRLDVRTDAAMRLIDTGEYAVPFLISWISNPDQGIRWRIAFILGEIGSPESIKSLDKMVSDPSGAVREIAGEAICKIDHKKR